MPGPSHIPTTNTNNTSESDSEDENQISDDEKCCVSKLFTPKEVRESPCLIFTKWIQCDQCRHWVHLIYCTEKRVIRKEMNCYASTARVISSAMINTNHAIFINI